MFIRLRQLRFPLSVHIRPREKLQRRRTGQIPRQDKAPRLNKVQPFTFATQEIVGVGLGDSRQFVFIRRSQRIAAFTQRQPRLGPLGAIALQQAGHLPRPGQIVLFQHRQVQQPLAGIIDDFQVQGRRVFEMTQQ
ncbi:hypothetical protein D3C72_1618680 [compost metagenome]